MTRRLFPARRVLWMDPGGVPPSFGEPDGGPCCAEMGAALRNDCAEHADDPFACPDMLLSYSPVFDEYGLILHDGSGCVLLVSACPFCGASLPEGRRDRFFDEVDALGLPADAELPARYHSAAWRKEPPTA